MNKDRVIMALAIMEYRKHVREGSDLKEDIDNLLSDGLKELPNFSFYYLYEKIGYVEKYGGSNILDSHNKQVASELANMGVGRGFIEKVKDEMVQRGMMT